MTKIYTLSDTEYLALQVTLDMLHNKIEHCVEKLDSPLRSLVESMDYCVTDMKHILNEDNGEE